MKYKLTNYTPKIQEIIETMNVPYEKTDNETIIYSNNNFLEDFITELTSFLKSMIEKHLKETINFEKMELLMDDLEMYSFLLEENSNTYNIREVLLYVLLEYINDETKGSKKEMFELYQFIHYSFEKFLILHDHHLEGNSWKNHSLEIPIVLFREIEKQIEVKRLRKLSIERLEFLNQQGFKEIPSEAIGALKVYYYAENWNGVDDSLYLTFFDKGFKVLEDEIILKDFETNKTFDNPFEDYNHDCNFEEVKDGIK